MSEINELPQIILECSNCRKPLVSLVVTDYDTSVQTLVIAECPFCGDKSFEKNIAGLFHVGGTDDTIVVDIDSDSSPAVFTVKKR